MKSFNKRKTGNLRKSAAAISFLLLFLLSFSACSSLPPAEISSSVSAPADAVPGSDPAASSGKNSENRILTDPAVSNSLTYSGTLPLDYAECFRVFRYDRDYSLISICDGTCYLLVPEGQPVPADLDSDITVLQRPVGSIYLAASACMDMFVKINALNRISLSGVQADRWYIPEARTAMENGSILYAGKYSIPDYELILSRNCDLAIENTMIFHTPEVREQLIRTGIPVLVDHASYESHPLGRTEWVKLYGVLTGHEKEADEAFAAQKAACESASDDAPSGRSAAFFSIRPSGSVTIRKSTDYVPAMIRLAGGIYLPDDLSDGVITSTTTLQMEEFCRRVRDADCLIYNSTIEGEITSVSELLNRAPAMKTFKAVRNGRIWYTEQNFYQNSMESGIMISDFHKILTDPDSSDDSLRFLKKLNP